MTKALQLCIKEWVDFYFFKFLNIFIFNTKKHYPKFYPGDLCLESQSGLSPSHITNNNQDIGSPVRSSYLPLVPTNRSSEKG